MHRGACGMHAIDSRAITHVGHTTCGLDRGGRMTVRYTRVNCSLSRLVITVDVPQDTFLSMRHHRGGQAAVALALQRVLLFNVELCMVSFNKL